MWRRVLRFGILRPSLAWLAILLCATGAGLTASSAQTPGGLAPCEPALLRASVRPGGAGEERLRTVALVLAGHNAERASLGLPPLAWSCALEADAARWAQALAARGSLEHAGREERRGAGENLWMGSAGRFTVDEMVARFVAEKRDFRHGRFPDVSATGNWSDVGHYSQIVWRDTREVGCALARGSPRDVLVCRYLPAGNIMGRTAF